MFVGIRGGGDSLEERVVRDTGGHRCTFAFSDVASVGMQVLGTRCVSQVPMDETGQPKGYVLPSQRLW